MADTTETLMFEMCKRGGYDFDEGGYDPTKPLCYDGAVRALRKFPVVPLCGRGSAVGLEDIDYCAECRFHSKRDE